MVAKPKTVGACAASDYAQTALPERAASSSGGQGRSRTVNVEVRRKRTYVKRDVLEEEARQQQEETGCQASSAEEDARLAKEAEAAKTAKQEEAEARQTG